MRALLAVVALACSVSAVAQQIKIAKPAERSRAAVTNMDPGDETEVDILTLATDLGNYDGKRVRIDEFRRKHRGGQGVRLIALEGRKTGLVAAVQQVTDQDEELVLISSGGQVIRTETPTINRYSAQARGVIVMRLAEGDTVAAIAAFRPGLAERGEMGENGAPDGPDGGTTQGGPAPT